MTTDRALLQRVGLWVVLLMVANVVSTGIFVYASFRASEDARQHNCDQVAAAFEAYTQALADVSGADEDTVADFRAAYRPHMQECH